MNQHQVKGKVKDAVGEVQKRAGRAAGDRDAVARGQARQTEGKTQKKMGDLKDGLGKILRKP